MLRTVFKLIHFLALAAFVGSIFSHILLGAFHGSGLAADALILGLKNSITKVLIFGGIGFLVVSGLGLIFANDKRMPIKRWLQIKIALVLLVTANAVFVLAPTGAERARQAANAIQGIPLLSNYQSLGLREDLFGAANLLMVLIIITLSIRRRPA